MITRIDIGDALAMLAANAPDKTPEPNEATMAAWSKYYDGYLGWTGDDLVAAAHELCKRPRERLVQPADLGLIIQRFRRDAYERSDPNTREDAWSDLGGRPPAQQLAFGGGYVDSAGQRRDRYGYVDKSVPDPEYPEDWSSDQRLAAYWQRVRSGYAEVPPVVCPVEHPPGAECADPSCDKPSTFAQFCAKHYVLSGLAKLGIRV
jgi:hypothetical protein